MRSVILVPRRAGIPERDAAWAWCRARWEAILPDLRIYEGADVDPTGPFNRAASLNDAARQADQDGRWDLAVVVDADIFIDPANVLTALDVAAAKGKVTWAFQRWNGLTKAASDGFLGLSVDVPARGLGPAGIEKTNPISWSCCFVVPRAIWDELGGFDERFRGWGWEDMAFQSVVCGLYGHERIDGDVYHLWHPRAEERIRVGTPLHPAYVANRMLGRRYMKALRDLGLHDRPTPSDEADMEQDRQNIRRLVAVEELRNGKPRPGMPDWRDWWPTLEELRDSAKRGDIPGPRQRLAIVVRTGGALDRWPARSAYLRASLASLADHVRYEPTVARVVYSDWPAEVADELTAIAGEHGFYVVGSGNRGFTPAMAGLWRYMRTREWPYDIALLVEDDFTYERDVPVDELARTLTERPHLLQVALLRDAFYQAERDAGGILGHPADAFETVSRNGSSWMEHQRFFTLNPTLVRRSIFDTPWPTAQHSEAVFGRQAFARDPRKRSALWGSGETWVRHLGEVRAGTGY